jgi:hypothetical protein
MARRRPIKEEQNTNVVPVKIEVIERKQHFVIEDENKQNTRLSL